MTVYGHGSTDPRTLEKYDHLPPEMAIIRAWTDGDPSPRWHALAIRDVHQAMPLLARAVERLIERDLERREDEIRRRDEANTLKDALFDYDSPKVFDDIPVTDEGQLITDAINADPDEIARLIKAREQARSGQTICARQVWEYIENFLSNPSTGVKRSRPKTTGQPEPSDPPASPQP